ncbi:MAG: matrixin family metalloprotease [Pseudohongiellaceae bacterium]
MRPAVPPRIARALLFSTLTLTGFVSPALHAFDINENQLLKWPGARTTIYAGLPERTASGETYQQAIIDAAAHWSEVTPFQFEVSPEYRDPCRGYADDTGAENQSGGDGVNGQGFADTVCGQEFNDNTLAVTVQYWEPNTLGVFDLVEADVIYNSEASFDIYDGPLSSGNDEFAGIDFRRTALHELGHVLGLGHERDEPAIMAPNIGNLFRLQEDDIAGAQALYRGISGCPQRQGGFGRFDDALEDDDCRVSQLMSGGSDDSPVDVYTFSLDEEATVDARVAAGALDGVLILADSGLDILALDDDSGSGCNPRIRQSLPAGDYVLLVNTWDVAEDADPPCGDAVRGDYRLSVSHESEQLLTLRGKESFQGGEAEAQFFGAVTVDGGESYRSRVRPDQAFDVEGRILVDPAHQGEPGYIVVAAITDAGETLVKNERGAFVTYRPARQLVPIAERRVLSGVEIIDVMTGMVAEDIDIDDIEVDFFIGYGVDSDPDELYFHSQPINLIVE